MNFKKTLLIGNKGQLGKEFNNFFIKNDYEFIGVDVDLIDITNYSALKELIWSIKPTLIINCSAYTLVDLAEKEQERALDVNANGPKYLAEISKKMGSFLVHFSTDYVFDGKSNVPYSETSNVNPINFYGQSKLDGENFIKEIFDDFLLFRLSWVYGNGTQNFVYKFREWAEKNSVLNVSDDEISIPTNTKFILNNSIEALQKNISGLYHLVPEGHCSRFEWAKEIAKKFNIIVEINKVKKDFFNLPAKRPDFSAMNSQLIQSLLKTNFADWKYYFNQF